MQNKEKQIEKKVCDYAKSKGVLCYKFSSPACRGVPDRIFFFPKGVVVLIEFKSAVGKLSTLQELTISKLLDKEAVIFVVNDSNKGIEIIDSILAKVNQ